MKIVTTGSKILLLIILLSPLAIHLESCKKADPVTPPVNNNSNRLPILTTTTVNTITATSALTGGLISSAGGLPIQSRGVVWSTSPNPTIALITKTIDGTGTGIFISTLNGLSPDTIYFVRAYATTSLGTAYGNEISFKSSSIPSVGIQVGNKLVGSGAIGNAKQGHSVSISADGNTLVFSGPGDNNYTGAIWIYNRTNNVWNQVAKLIVSGAFGIGSVAISADGKTVIVGVPGDNNYKGAAWIYTQNNGIWTQEGSKLVGTGAIGEASQGSSVSISGDGNTVVIGGVNDNGIDHWDYIEAVGAAWVFTRNNGNWTQQGNKLVGTAADGYANQGSSVSISGDGNSLVIGGDADNNGIGAAWIFTRNNGMWTQQGSKLVGIGTDGTKREGSSVSISGDGSTLAVGGFGDNGGVGATWIFKQNNGMWAQQGSKLVGSNNIGYSRQGTSVSLNSDGKTVAVGGDGDNGNKGAVWVFNP